MKGPIYVKASKHLSTAKNAPDAQVTKMTRKITCFVLITTLAFLVVTSVPVYANASGAARVIDGDTIDVGGQVIRLHGIDAPENGQSCMARTDRSYRCGVDSQNFLRTLVRPGVSCVGSEYDTYDRLIAVCKSNGVDLNQQMVLAGHAVAYREYSMDYVNEESQASAAQRGLWAGEFEMPWDFRTKVWNTASDQTPLSDCPIKGNINRDGEKIYHAPWSSSYARTKINTAKSERWFCSEAEALAAGWRAPRR